MPWKSPQHRQRALDVWHKVEENGYLVCGEWFENRTDYPQRVKGCVLAHLVMDAVIEQGLPIAGEPDLFLNLQLEPRFVFEDRVESWTTCATNHMLQHMLQRDWGLIPDEWGVIIRRFDRWYGKAKQRGELDALFEELARDGEGENPFRHTDYPIDDKPMLPAPDLPLVSIRFEGVR